MTAALAASTRRRRGLAPNVARISGRRYSEVMNSTATGIRTSTPKNRPNRLFWVGSSGPSPLPMVPEPVTVNSPPACVELPGAGSFRSVCPMVSPTQVPAAAPVIRTWSKAARLVVAVSPAEVALSVFLITFLGGEVTNRPTCTVAAGPASRTVPAGRQVTPSAERLAAAAAPARVSRSQDRGCPGSGAGVGAEVGAQPQDVPGSHHQRRVRGSGCGAGLHHDAGRGPRSAGVLAGDPGHDAAVTSQRPVDKPSDHLPAGVLGEGDLLAALAGAGLGEVVRAEEDPPAGGSVGGGEVKTERSRRTLALPQLAVDALRAHSDREKRADGLG